MTLGLAGAVPAAAQTLTPAGEAVAASARAGGVSAGDVLTLDEAIAQALRNNRNVASATMQVDRAQQRVDAARARRLPSVELQGLAGTTLNTIRVTFPEGTFGTYPGVGPIPSTDRVAESPRSVAGTLSATVAQPLTTLHRIGLNTKMGEISREIEKEKLREERAAVAADGRRLYYQILQAESALTAKQEQVKVYRELDRVVGEQVVLEVALRSDGLQVKSRLASEEYEMAALT